MRVLFLDKRNVLISDEMLSLGSIDHVTVSPREIIKRSLELKASGLVLVHNHPSGCPKPSRVDVTMTETIVIAAKLLGIEVYDHIIVGRYGQQSFRKLKLM